MNDAQILAAVDTKRDAALAAHRFVHEHPEFAHEERECARYLCAVLEQAGLEVERGVAGMDTAFRATLAGGRAGPSVGLVSLYDAVPVFRPEGTIEPVHSCGHDAIAAGVVAAALALADLRDDLSGTLVVFGCPADEIPAPLTVARGAGKLVSAAAGLWDGIDAALYAHPEFVDSVFRRSRWMRRDRATVTGTRPAPGRPSKPLRLRLRLRLRAPDRARRPERHARHPALVRPLRRGRQPLRLPLLRRRRRQLRGRAGRRAQPVRRARGVRRLARHRPARRQRGLERDRLRRRQLEWLRLDGADVRSGCWPAGRGRPTRPRGRRRRRAARRLGGRRRLLRPGREPPGRRGRKRWDRGWEESPGRQQRCGRSRTRSGP